MRQVYSICRISVLMILALSAAAYGQHPALSTYDGAQSCATCHSGYKFNTQTMASEVMKSTHYTFRDSAYGTFSHEGTSWETRSEGKWTRYCGLPGSVAKINWLGVFNGVAASGCGRCHIGGSDLKPDSNGTDSWKKIDCLVCHADNYFLNGTKLGSMGARMPVKVGTVFQHQFPSGADLDSTSKSITKQPTTHACIRCHNYNGGGFLYKRGNDYHVDDLHSTQANLQCTDCHKTHEHRISVPHPDPAMIATGAPDSLSGSASCERCHTDAPHMTVTNSTTYNTHVEKLACTACHTPTHKGLVEKKFNEVVKFYKNAVFQQWNFNETTLSTPQPPEYKWWNETVFDDVAPRGSRGDGKIYPFKHTRAWIPYDIATGNSIPIKLGVVFGAPESTSTDGMQTKITAAIRQGAKETAATYGFALDTLGNYAAEFGWRWEDMYGHPGHGVKSAEALKCGDCHSPSGVVDFSSLGYTPEEVTHLQTLYTDVKSGDGVPAEFALKQNYPNPFNPSTSIEFHLPKGSAVSLKVFDLLGHEARVLINNRYLPSGIHVANFSSDGMPSGIYLYKLEAEGRTFSRKMLLMK